MSSVPLERLLAIARVPPVGVKLAGEPEYVPLKTTVAPAAGEKTPPLTEPLKVTVDPLAGEKGPAGDWAGERGTTGKAQAAGAADHAGESCMARGVIDRVIAAVQAERTAQGNIGTAADGDRLGLVPQTSGLESAGRRSRRGGGECAAVEFERRGTERRTAGGNVGAAGDVQRAGGHVVGDHQGAAAGGARFAKAGRSTCRSRARCRRRPGEGAAAPPLTAPLDDHGAPGGRGNRCRVG